MAFILIVTRLPIEELCTPFGAAELKRDLQQSDIRALLKDGRVRFVIADVGCELRWVNETECYNFWKDEARDHIGALGKSYLEDFSGGFFYGATEWSDNGSPIVLLSKYH